MFFHSFSKWNAFMGFKALAVFVVLCLQSLFVGSYFGCKYTAANSHQFGFGCSRGLQVECHPSRGLYFDCRYRAEFLCSTNLSNSVFLSTLSKDIL